MPFYRITIWLKDQRKPVSGIRFIQQTNIDLVQNQMESKAKSFYDYSKVKDVEVAMLSKNATVIRRFQNIILRRSGNM